MASTPKKRKLHWTFVFVINLAKTGYDMSGGHTCAAYILAATVAVATAPPPRITGLHTAASASSASSAPSELAWVDRPQSWHQQAIRIVDHPFTTLQELKTFALSARKAGVSVVELVGSQKTERCLGYWYGGLGLCDHVRPVPPCLCDMYIPPWSV